MNLCLPTSKKRDLSKPSRLSWHPRICLYLTATIVRKLIRANGYDPRTNLRSATWAYSKLPRNTTDATLK